MKLLAWTSTVCFFGLVSLAAGKLKSGSEKISEGCEKATFVISMGREGTKLGLETASKNPLLQIQDMAKETIFKDKRAPPTFVQIITIPELILDDQPFEVIILLGNGTKDYGIEGPGEYEKMIKTIPEGLKVDHACSSPTSMRLSGTEDVETNYKDQYGMTALHWAAVSGNVSAGMALIRQGADINARDKYNSTALHLAYCNADFSKMLLDAGAKADLINKEKATPLMMAVFKGRTDVIGVLAEGGANVNLASDTGETPLMLGAEYGEFDTVEKLIQHGASTNGTKAVLLAASRGKTDMVKLLLESGADVDVKSSNGNTPLIEAAKAGYLDTVKELIARGADLNATNNNGNNALHEALLKKHGRVAAHLQSSGIDVNAKNKDGLTPSQIANGES